MVRLWNVEIFLSLILYSLPSGINSQEALCIRGAGKEACAGLSAPPCRRHDAYLGQRNRTLSGRPCQPWHQQFPHKHNFSDTEGLALLGHNFCRNPDGDMGPWCLTTDPKQRWEYCFSNCASCVSETGKCAEQGAMSCRMSTAYDGPKNTTISVELWNTTISGLPCRRWVEQDAEFAAMGGHNECRNPDNEAGPWCYVDHPTKRWEFCFPSCQGCECPKEPVVFPAGQPFGEIYSPRKTNQYCSDLNCRWRIENPTDSLLRLELIQFATEDRVDSLEISFTSPDGIGFSVRNLSGNIAEAKLPKLHFGPGTVELRFSTDDSIVSSGFHGAFQRVPLDVPRACVCHVEVLRLGPIPLRLASPAYDEGGCSNMVCDFLLVGEPGQRLHLVLEDLDGGSIQISDGVTGEPLESFRGSQTQPTVVESRTERLRLRYAAADAPAKSRGFLAMAKALLGPCQCVSQPVYTAPTGHLHSPGFPGLVCPRLNCTWTVSLPKHMRVQLRFEYLHLSRDSSLMIAGAGGDFVSPIIAWPQLGKELLFSSEESQVDLRLVTGDEDSFPGDEMAIGFNVSWIAYPKEEDCRCWSESKVSALSGSVAQGSCAPLDCFLRLEKPENASKLSVHLDHVELTPPHDFARLYDGIASAGEPPKLLYSSVERTKTKMFNWSVEADSALLHFHTSQVGEGQTSGLRLRYAWTLRSCDCPAEDIYVFGPGHLTSPNYPEEYCHDALCRWTLRAPPGYTLQLRVEDFVTENFDRLRISELSSEDGSELVLGELAGRATGEFLSKGPNVMLTFTSDASIAYRGYRIGYAAVSSFAIPTDPPVSIPPPAPPTTAAPTTATTPPPSSTALPTTPPPTTQRRGIVAMTKARTSTTEHTTEAPVTSTKGLETTLASKASKERATTKTEITATTGTKTTGKQASTLPVRVIHANTSPEMKTNRTSESTVATELSTGTTYALPTTKPPRIVRLPARPKQLPHSGKRLPKQKPKDSVDADAFLEFFSSKVPGRTAMGECEGLATDLRLMRTKYYELMLMKAMKQMEREEKNITLASFDRLFHGGGDFV